MYMLNKVGKRRQPCQTPVLTFIGCANVTSTFIFILLLSYNFITAVSNVLGIFILCKILNSHRLLTSSKAFS